MCVNGGMIPVSSYVNCLFIVFAHFCIWIFTFRCFIEILNMFWILIFCQLCQSYIFSLSLSLLF